MVSAQITENYLQILQEELIPALGCTEPISLAFAAAKVRDVLGCLPEKITVQASGNIIKNVKGVVVPNSGGLKGVVAAIAMGVIGGDANKNLEVLEGFTQTDIEQAENYRDTVGFKLQVLSSAAKLHLIIFAEGSGHQALVEIIHQHTHIVRIEKDNRIVFSIPYDEKNSSDALTDRSMLSIENIVAFAETVPLDRVLSVIEKQIICNSAISKEGLLHQWGVNVGKNLIKHYGNDVRIRAKAAAAAGSDARMSGCVLPVVINSGSGNQGMTASLPVIEYALELGKSHESLIRALLISNLCAIHQKTKIGRLSAYCGVVSAACGAGAAITWMHGGSFQQIEETMTNTLANVSGILCDGAKPSCAAKIASSVDAAIMAHYLSSENQAFVSGDGIVKNTLENTIIGIGKIANEGMVGTDTTILSIMIDG